MNQTRVAKREVMNCIVSLNVHSTKPTFLGSATHNCSTAAANSSQESK